VAQLKALEVDIREKLFPNQVCAIRKLAFSAEQGEFLALVGPSGAGKSTLLNIVAGLDRHVDGEVRINIEHADAEQAAAPRIGFMFQEARLLPWLTAIENVSLVLPMEKQGQAREFLDKVGLAGFEHAYPGQLSGGMQRRVSLARAFAFEPQLLLMDEPFQSLDAPTADQLRDLLLEFWKHSGCTVLFVTHSLREALAMAERILFFSPRPASVVNEFNVDLARPRKLDGEGVSALYHELIKQHPRLLSGLDSNPESSETIRTHEWHETRAV
jgi:ABC-type nitrate/sulfonate/bicarbonate transport system ATPase subunit